MCLPDLVYAYHPEYRSPTISLRWSSVQRYTSVTARCMRTGYLPTVPSSSYSMEGDDNGTFHSFDCATPAAAIIDTVTMVFHMCAISPGAAMIRLRAWRALQFMLTAMDAGIRRGPRV